jgi:hypothetical protein
MTRLAETITLTPSSFLLRGGNATKVSVGVGVWVEVGAGVGVSIGVEVGASVGSNSGVTVGRSQSRQHRHSRSIRTGVGQVSHNRTRQSIT